MSDWIYHLVENYNILLDHTVRAFTNGAAFGICVSSLAGLVYQSAYKQSGSIEDYALPVIGGLISGAVLLYHKTHKSQGLQEFHATLSELKKSGNLSGRELEDLLRDRDI